MQNEIDYIQDEIMYFSELEKVYNMKSNNYYRYNILSMMTNSDIAEIIGDKNEELKKEKKLLTKEVFGLRGDNRKIMILLSEDKQNDLLKMIKSLQFELKQRSPYTRTNDIPLEELKDKIDIVDLIERFTGSSISTTIRLHKCFLPDHEDNTASFKIYENTNSWYCQGCRRGGDHIEFIRHYLSCDYKEAIKRFKNLFI